MSTRKILKNNYAMQVAVVKSIRQRCGGITSTRGSAARRFEKRKSSKMRVERRYRGKYGPTRLSQSTVVYYFIRAVARAQPAHEDAKRTRGSGFLNERRHVRAAHRCAVGVS